MGSEACSWRAMRVWLGVGVMALVVAGCATRGYDRTTRIADNMAKQTAGMQAAKPQVDAMLASLDSFGDVCVSRREYEEWGAAIVHKKCL